MDERAEIDAGGEPERSRGRLGAWGAGCALLAGLIVAYWAGLPADGRLRVPTSPLDNVAGLSETPRHGWAFLWQVREILPPGATYTVVAPDRDTEMSLYMLSWAVLTECRALPTSYYGTPTPERGAEARFVLAYGCEGAVPGATLVQRLNEGCIWDRGAR